MEYKITPPTAEELQIWKYRIQSAFKIFDAERDGTIPNTEVSTVMRYLGYFPSERDIVQVILPKMMGEDPSTFVQYEVFEEVMLQIMVNEEYLPSTDDALLAAFRVIDEDGKGWISVSELTELLTKKRNSVPWPRIGRIYSTC